MPLFKMAFSNLFWVFIPAFYSVLESSHTVRQSTLIPLPALMVFRIENKFNFSACTWTEILNNSSRLKNKSAPPCHPHQSHFSEVTTTFYSLGNCLCHCSVTLSHCCCFLICHLSGTCWLSVLSDKQFISLYSSSSFIYLFNFLFLFWLLLWL